MSAERKLTTRKIVFVGNCQLIKLSALYRNTLTAGLHGAAYHINPLLEPTKADQHELAQADCVIWQIADGASKVDRSLVPRTTEVIDVPLISAVFLWPFAGRPHPRNQRLPHSPNGPFDPELGDVFLNGLIRDGVRPEEAVKRYLELDLSRRTNLDRLFELWREAQRRRDRASGFEMVDLIERRFRDEQVFLTPHHPGLPVFTALARQVLRRIGFANETVDRALATLRMSPFAPTCLPVHPAVARHFGLRWVAGNQRYPLRHEGEFTFPEFVRRYVEFDWNEALAEGLHLSVGPNAVRARALLEEGLKRAPASATGHIVLSQTALRTGDAAAAQAAARIAIALEPSNPHGQVALGSSLARSGDLAGAETAFRRALALDSAFQPGSLELGRLLMDQKRLQEACEVVGAGLDHLPRDLAMLLLAAKILVEQGLLDEAEGRLREAIAIKPTLAEPHWQLAEVLAMRARRDVVANYEALVETNPGNGDAQAGLGVLRMRVGSYAEAETSFRSAVQLSPTEIGYKLQLVNAISRQRRVSEALALAEGLARDNPFDPSVKALVERLTSQAKNETDVADDSMKKVVAPVRDREPHRIAPAAALAEMRP
jgi:tetratricopeptide (TPR) repeat protein